jgi:hypothetical protein
MIFEEVLVQFRIRIRIHTLELRIPILQKVSDPWRIWIPNTADLIPESHIGFWPDILQIYVLIHKFYKSVYWQ